MPASIAWINPGRLLRICIDGTITYAEFASLQPQLQAALEKSPARLDYLIEVKAHPELASQGISENLLPALLDKRSFLRSTKTGRLLVIGGDPASQLTLKSLALALGLELYHFEDVEAAFRFVADSD